MLWPFKEKINIMRGLVFRRALGRSWCWSLIGKMPLIKGRRRSSVLAEAVRGANKILLVCQVISTIIFFYYYERDTYAEILHLCFNRNLIPGYWGKLYTRIFEFGNAYLWIIHFLIADIILKSYTGIDGIDQIVYRYRWNCKLVLIEWKPRKRIGLFPIPVYDFINTGIKFRQYQYTILYFTNTGIWFCQYWLTISSIAVNNSSIAVNNFVSSSKQFRQYWYMI